MSSLQFKKSSNIIDLTPDSDCINIIGQVDELQIMESKDISGQSLITASFILADETASARVRLQNNDEIRKLKNGDILILKNGRVDVIGNKLIIGNDIWSKIMIISDKTLENVNRSFNISEIQYDIKSF